MTNKTVYPIGDFSLLNHNLLVTANNGEKYEIVPMNVTIYDDRKVLVVVGETKIVNGIRIRPGVLHTTGKVQKTKMVGCKFEVLISHKGIKVHLPFIC